MGGEFLVALLLGISAIDQSTSADSAKPAPPRLTRVRGATAESHKLIAEGYTRSATLGALVDRIQQQQVMVLIQLGDCAKGRFRSCVSNVQSDGKQRFIWIKISPLTTTDRLIATIAHELQHAEEILSEATAVDADTTLALYRRIGTGTCREGLSEACETAAAGVVERRVLEELHEAQQQAPRDAKIAAAAASDSASRRVPR